MNKSMLVAGGLVVALCAGGVVLAVGSGATGRMTIHPGTHSLFTADAVGVEGGAPGFGRGSFQANGRARVAVYISADGLFGRDAAVTVGDLRALEYWTNRDATAAAAAANWIIRIYTVPDGVNDDTAWYGRRLTLAPYFAENKNEPDNTWVQWSTRGAGPNHANRLRVVDPGRAEFRTVAGSRGDPFLRNLIGGPVDWRAYDVAYTGGTVDYRDEQIWFIGIEVPHGAADGFQGLVDGLTVSWDDGRAIRSASVDFEK